MASDAVAFVASDVTKIFDGIQDIHYLWTAPFEALAILTILVVLVKEWALPGARSKIQTVCGKAAVGMQQLLEGLLHTCLSPSPWNQHPTALVQLRTACRLGRGLHCHAHAVPGEWLHICPFACPPACLTFCSSVHCEQHAVLVP